MIAFAIAAVVVVPAVVLAVGGRLLCWAVERAIGVKPRPRRNTWTHEDIRA